MSKQPEFALRRVFEDGSESEARIVPVTALPWRTQLGRRGLFGVGLSAAALGRAWAAKAGAPAARLRAHLAEITALALAAGGNLLATAGKDLATKIWKPFQPGSPVSLPARPLPVNALALARGGSLLVAAATDQCIQRIRLPEGALEGEAPKSSNYLSGLAVSEDGEVVAYGGWDNAPRLWQGAGAEFRRLEGHARYVTAVALSADAQTLLSGSWDATLRIWKLPGGECAGVLKGHTGYIEQVRFLPGGRAVTGAADGAIRVWSLKELREEARFEFGAGPVRALVCTADGRKLYAACGEESIRVLDLQAQREEAALEGHAWAVTALALADSGALLASGDAGGTVMLWDPAAGARLGYLFDEKVNQENAVRYNAYDRRTQTTLSYTLPCGAPLPAGAVCTCNCVRGTYSGPASPARTTRCTCDQVCTCVPVARPGGGRRCICVPVRIG